MSNQYYPSYKPTYTQILNLDQFSNVSVEEIGQSKYFNVDGLPRTIGYGKHYFTISYNDPKNSSLLKEDSSIMFEAVDERGNIIWSELTDYNDVNGAGIGYIWIKEDPLRTYDEIYNGIGKLIIVGKLEDETYIRYTIPLDIRKDYPNTSPVLFKQTPTVSINETVQLDKNDTNFKRSYGIIELDKLSTYGGYVHSIKLSTKSSKGKSDRYQLLDEFKVEPSFETLRSPVSSGSDYIGRFSDFTDTIQYWVTSSLTSVTSSHNDDGGSYGFKYGVEISTPSSQQGSIHYISLRKSTEEKVYDFKYTVSGSGFAQVYELPSSASTNSGLDDNHIIYSRQFSRYNPSSSLGPEINEDIHPNISASRYAKGGYDRGYYIQDDVFIDSDKYYAIRFKSLDPGHVSEIGFLVNDISFKNKSRRGLNPNYYIHKFEYPTKRRSDNLDFIVKFKNPAGEYSQVIHSGSTLEISSSKVFSGAPFILEKDDNLVSGSLTVGESLGEGVKLQYNKASERLDFVAGIETTTGQYQSKFGAVQGTLFSIRAKPTGSGIARGIDIEGDLRVSGSIYGHQYVLSSSVTNIIIQQLSGSTQFGDSSDDMHKFEGDISASGDFVVEGNISGSATSTGSFGKLESVTSGSITRLDSTNISATSGSFTKLESVTSGSITRLDSTDIDVSGTGSIDYLKVDNRLSISGSLNISGSYNSLLSEHRFEGDISASGNIKVGGNISASGDSYLGAEDGATTLYLPRFNAVNPYAYIQAGITDLNSGVGLKVWGRDNHGAQTALFSVSSSGFANGTDFGAHFQIGDHAFGDNTRLTVEGDISASGELIVDKSGSFGDNLTVAGDISASGDYYAGDGIWLGGTKITTWPSAGSEGDWYDNGSGVQTSSMDIIVDGFISASGNLYLKNNMSKIIWYNDESSGRKMSITSLSSGGLWVMHQSTVRMSISSSGGTTGAHTVVGIGTTKPTKTLTVEGSISASGDLYVGGTYQNDLTVQGDISASGDLIIGGEDTQPYKFQVYHSAKQIAHFERTTGTGTAFIRLQGGGGSATHWHITGSTSITELTQIGTSDGISTTNLSIDGFGKVGIIKKYPTTELEVEGDISASGNLYLEGSIVGSNLSGTNTGDQDLSTYLQNSDTGSMGDLTVEGSISASNTIYAETGSFNYLNAPGAILGYTAIGIDAAADLKLLGTSFGVTDADHNVSFIAPPSGVVEIFVSIMGDLMRRNTYFGLSDNATYAAIDFPNTNDPTNEHLVAIPSGTPGTEDYQINHSWVVTGLTPGDTYKWWLGAKASGTFSITLRWGGTATEEYAPFIMKATALPSNIYTG